MLSTVFSKEKTRSIIDVMPDEMIVWKVVLDGTRRKEAFPKSNCIVGKWNSYFTHGPLWLYSVYDEIKAVDMDEDGRRNMGFRSFCKRISAEKLMDCDSYRDHAVVVAAMVSKKHITAMGDDGIDGIRYDLTIVTSRIIMPTYPNTDITKELSEAPLIEECREVMELMTAIA